MRPARGPVGDWFRVGLEWSDATTHGTTLSGRLFPRVREVLYPRTTARLLAASGHVVAIDELCALVAEDRASEAHAEIVADPEFMAPDEQRVSPHALHVRSQLTGDAVRVPLAGRVAHELAAALREPAMAGAGSPELLRRLVDETAAEARARGLARVLRRSPHDGRALYIGHACVTWTCGELRLWCDPFLPPKSPRYPSRYPPLGPLDFPERAHAVLLTHSHPDHFDPASLLLFPADTLILIPEIARESLLSVNLRLRLQQLGFTRVEAMPWWSARRIGGFEVSALPFYGEQPLGWGGEPLTTHNCGNTYAVREPGGRLDLLLADSGPDPRMSVEQHARALRRALGRVDTLFANHRRWRLYPPQYLLTSVPQYLCHVPAAELGIQQQIMMDPEQVAGFAEAVAARHVVPYAMGGARWHEELGLGFDHLSRRRSTAFDASPHDLCAEVDGQRDIRVRRSFTPVVLAAGQALGSDGVPRLAPGLRLPGPGEFRRARAEAAPRCIAVHGSGVTPTLTRHLVALTTLDPGAFLIASAGFVELHGTPGPPGELLRVMLARYLESIDAVQARRARPLTGAPFDAPRWSRRFHAAHLAVFTALRGGEDLVIALRPVCAGLGAGPPELLDALRRQLLGGQRRAAPLIRRHGPEAVLRGLLAVKLIHNMCLTHRSIGEVDGIEEAAVFAAVLGASE